MAKMEPRAGGQADSTEELEPDRQERWNRRKQRRKSYEEDDERYQDKGGKRHRFEDHAPDWEDELV